jgi:hypothetical protein
MVSYEEYMQIKILQHKQNKSLRAIACEIGCLGVSATMRCVTLRAVNAPQITLNSRQT